MTRAPYCFARAQISGSLAMSPPMENTPSVTISAPAVSGTFCRHFSSSAMSLWR